MIEFTPDDEDGGLVFNPDPRECGHLGCGHPRCVKLCDGVPLEEWLKWRVNEVT